jgi:fumarate reductase flavoprotein subunit
VAKSRKVNRKGKTIMYDQLTKNGLTRRGLIKGAAFGTGAAVLSGLLVKEAKAVPPPQKWDREADVVIVGAGGSGIAAAWEATNAKAEVLLLEKGVVCGGASVIAGGTFSMVNTPLQREKGITDSVESLIEDIDKKMAKYTGDKWVMHELNRAFAENCGRAYDWLVGLGAKISDIEWQPDHKVRRSHLMNPPEVFNLVKEDATKKGAKFLLETPVRRLVVNPKGRVVGVLAENKGKRIYIKARRSVVLATGGFCHNKELLAHYYGPGLEKCVVAPPPTHTGDGLLMGQAIGANTMKMGVAVDVGSPKHPITKIAVAMAKAGGIVVDKMGKRIGDESAPDHEFPGMFQVKAPDGLGWQIYDMKIMSEYTHRPPYKKGQQYKYAIEGNTIEELAQKIGIPAANLKETIDKYNSDIDQPGYDTVFGRKALIAGPPSRGKLVKIDTPPFSAIESYPSLTHTIGGLRINPKGQVLHIFGEIIPGLYAAGEVAPAIKMGGCCYGGAYVWGRIAGKNATAEKPWDAKKA